MIEPVTDPTDTDRQLAAHLETMLGIVPPPACLAGVAIQLDVLREHAGRLLGGDPA